MTKTNLLKPKFHQDLENKILFCESLQPFHVPWKHVNMEKQRPTSDLDTFMLDEMCINAVKGIHLQSSREYWDNQLSSSDERATSIVKLTQTERQNLPAENLVCERSLATFGHIASNSASHSSKRFKAKRIRDDLMITKEDTLTVSISNNTFQEVFQVLDEMEDAWTEDKKKAKKRSVKSCNGER